MGILSIGLVFAGGLLLSAALKNREASQNQGSASATRQPPAGPKQAPSAKPAPPKKAPAAPIDSDMIPIRLIQERYVNDRLRDQPFDRTFFFARDERLSLLLRMLDHFIPETDTHSWEVYCRGNCIGRLKKSSSALRDVELYIPDCLATELPEQTLTLHRLNDSQETCIPRDAAQKGTEGPAPARKRAPRSPETIEQLERLLQEGGFPRYSYSFQGGLPNEAFCMEKTPEGWHVYYSERGSKNTLGRCATEKEAVACFLEAVRPYLKLAEE